MPVLPLGEVADPSHTHSLPEPPPSRCCERFSAPVTRPREPVSFEGLLTPYQREALKRLKAKRTGRPMGMRSLTSHIAGVRADVIVTDEMEHLADVHETFAAGFGPDDVAGSLRSPPPPVAPGPTPEDVPLEMSLRRRKLAPSLVVIDRPVLIPGRGRVLSAIPLSDLYDNPEEP